MSGLPRRYFLKSSAIAVSALSLGSWGLVAHARAMRSLRILVGFPPGGGSDRIARLLSESFHRQSNLDVYVENKSGAGGLIAAQALLQKDPASESVLLSHDHTISVLPLFPENGNTKFIAQLQPIVGIATFANAFAISSKVPVEHFSEYLPWLKTQGVAKSTVGVPAPNSIPEYLVKALNKHFQTNLNPVPYRGSSPMLTDLLGNQIPACVASVPELLEYQKAGYLRILAVIGKQRQTLLPNVPTFHELGVSGFENLAYYGLFGPPNIPKENMATIERMTKQSLEDTSLVEKLTALGLDVRYRNASQFKEQVQDYSREWQAIIASH